MSHSKAVQRVRAIQTTLVSDFRSMANAAAKQVRARERHHAGVTARLVVVRPRLTRLCTFLFCSLLEINDVTKAWREEAAEHQVDNSGESEMKCEQQGRTRTGSHAHS